MSSLNQKEKFKLEGSLLHKQPWSAKNVSATNICTSTKKKMEEQEKMQIFFKVGDAKCAHNELANANTKMFIEGKRASLST